MAVVQRHCGRDGIWQPRRGLWRRYIRRVQIEGHTDSRGSIEYNLALGERRANAVKSYLQSLGIPAARLKTISYGKERPLVTGESEDAWSKNRRANFVPVQ